MAGFNFPHHVTVGHVLPSLPMYFYGIFLMVRPFLLPDLRDKQTQALSNQRWAVRLAFLFFFVGLIYGGIHLGITLNCDNHGCSVRNWTHTFVGVSLIFSGVFQLLMASPGMRELTVDFAGPLGFAGVGTALVMHLDHDNTAQNVVHIAFALSMYSNAILWGIASGSPRWNIALGFSMVLAAVLLSASSDELVNLAQAKQLWLRQLGDDLRVRSCLARDRRHVLGNPTRSYRDGAATPKGRTTRPQPERSRD